MKKLKQFIQKVIEFFKEIFSDKEEKVEQKPAAPVEPTTPPPTQEAPPVEPKVPTQEEHQDEPAETSLSGEVTSFLWKPESDTNPKVAVIVVSADLIRSEHLKVKILDKDNRPLKVIPDKNKYSLERGNKLPQDKFGRINFKPGPTDKQFLKSAPLKVSFYIDKDGLQTPIKTYGKDFQVIKDPTKRWAGKGGKLVIENK